MKSILLISIFLSAFASYAQKGTVFPVMECKNIDGLKTVLPSGLSGKKSVLCLAYSQKAEQKLQGWLDASIHNLILRSSEQSLIPEEPYDIHAFFIAMYTGSNQSFAENGIKQMKTGVDVALHPYVLVYKGELEPYKSKLKLEMKDDPYVFVLDEKGTIIYTTHGIYTEKAMDEIEALIATD